MSIFGITFQAVAVLLGIGILGFWIIGRRHVPTNALVLLTSIAIDIALPCLVLANILTQFSPQEDPEWWQLPLWWIGFTLVTVILSLGTAFMVKREVRPEFTMSLLYQNGIFFPLIIITGIFGSESIYLVQLFLFIFLHPSFVFSTYALFYGKKAGDQKLNWKRIINPVMAVTLIGLVIGLASIKDYVPDFLVTILIMVGGMATPLFMLILGGNVYNDFMYAGKEGRKIYIKEVLEFIFIKNLLFPLVFLGLLIWLRPTYSIAFIIILQAAIPPITGVPIFAERYGGNRAIASQFIVASFVFSIVSIPAMIYLFSLYFPFPV